MQLQYNFSVWNGWNAYAAYNEENEGWLVTSMDVSTQPTSLLILQQNTPDNWTQTEQFFPAATGVKITIVFTRAGNYFVLNLLLPLLVIVFIANATIFIPADGGYLNDLVHRAYLTLQTNSLSHIIINMLVLVCKLLLLFIIFI